MPHTKIIPGYPTDSLGRTQCLLIIMLIIPMNVVREKVELECTYFYFSI